MVCRLAGGDLTGVACDLRAHGCRQSGLFRYPSVAFSETTQLWRAVSVEISVEILWKSAVLAKRADWLRSPVTTAGCCTKSQTHCGHDRPVRESR